MMLINMDISPKKFCNKNFSAYQRLRLPPQLKPPSGLHRSGDGGGLRCYRTALFVTS